MHVEAARSSNSQGKVEYKARSILEALYSMRYIKLFKRAGTAGTYVSAKARRVEAVPG